MAGRSGLKTGFLAGGVVAAAIVLAACAASPVRMSSRPGPAGAAEKPGPWGTTIARYDPSLYGPERPLVQIIGERRLLVDKGKLPHAVILVNKAQRRLELWVGRHMVKAYRIQLGWRAHGPKTRQGDLRVPEGRYYICAHRPSNYYLGLWLAYPNAADAVRGLEAGLIGPQAYEAILEKLAARACPPQDTKLGGDILIHGQLPALTARLAREHRDRPASLRPGWQPGDADPAAMTEFQDWTDGCIAMFNPDIRELYEFVADGTEVIVAANAAVTKPRSSPRR